MTEKGCLVGQGRKVAVKGNVSNQKDQQDDTKAQNVGVTPYFGVEHGQLDNAFRDKKEDEQRGAENQCRQSLGFGKLLGREYGAEYGEEDGEYQCYDGKSDGLPPSVAHGAGKIGSRRLLLHVF